LTVVVKLGSTLVTDGAGRIRRSLLAAWVLHQHAWIFMRKDLI